MDLSKLFTADSPLFDPARMKFCEETLAGPIAHPADTWTNIGPVIAGVAILLYARRPLERLLGVSALWTGVASGYFHATNTILGETLDLSGMFLFILSIMAIQQHRSRPAGSTAPLIWGVVIASLLITMLSAVYYLAASPLFGVLVLIVIGRGIYDRRLGPYAWAMVGTFLFAWCIWWLDLMHILCVPSNHILTGHGVWHLLNGLVFWFTYLHYDATTAHAEGDLIEDLVTNGSKNTGSTPEDATANDVAPEN